MANEKARSDDKQEQQPFKAERPEEVREWCWHMDLHLTEHDDRHAAMALRAAWPAVSKWLETVEGYWSSVVAALPVGKAAKWRGHFAHFYNGYWYVKRSAAEKEIAKASAFTAVGAGTPAAWLELHNGEVIGVSLEKDAELLRGWEWKPLYLQSAEVDSTP
jgi:hypothetical protein